MKKVVGVIIIMALVMGIVACSNQVSVKLPSIADAPYLIIITTPYENPHTIKRYCPENGWDLQSWLCCITFIKYYQWSDECQCYVYSEDRQPFCGMSIRMITVVDRRTNEQKVIY